MQGVSYNGPRDYDGLPEQPIPDGVQVGYDMDDGPLGGGVFTGSDAKMVLDRNVFKTDPPGIIRNPPDPSVAQPWEGPDWVSRPRIQNWFDCIKSRRLPTADVEIGHRSISVCHLANIARRVGRRLRWDPDKEIFIGDDEADAYVDRPRREGRLLLRTGRRGRWPYTTRRVTGRGQTGDVG